MSRHRNIRNLTRDDYYDDYDDDYYDDYEEDDEYYQQKQQPTKYNSTPPSKKNPNNKAATATPQKATTTAKIAVPGKMATTMSVGVTKPPPGWGKPTVTKTTTTATPGISKPPPGWGKPSSSSATTPSTTSAGITAPPPWWGKPTTTTPVKSTASSNTNVSRPNDNRGGISKPPAGWGKPNDDSTTKPSKEVGFAAAVARPITPPPSSSTSLPSNNTTTSTSSNYANYKSRPLPSFLKNDNDDTTTNNNPNMKSQLSMVVLGHVDAGKSTLMGQLLVQVGTVTQREVSQKNKYQGNLSWLLDENQSERDRGVTMEIATKSFRVPHHDIILLDAPGHADFIPIMITGAANADVAILVIASVKGEFEAGFCGGGQTKEHVLLARGLGVSQVLVAVNKLDVEGWKQERYEEIKTKTKEYLLQQQFGPKRIRFVPLSGLTGENVKERSDPLLTVWYKGPTLLEAIDGFQPASRHLEKPVRFIVTDVYAEGRGVTTRGRVIQGFLEVGDRLVVLPIGDVATVNKLEHLQAPSDDHLDPKRLSVAIAGDTVELVLSGIDIMRITVGNIVASPNPGARPPVAKMAKAKLLVMDQLTVPIIRGAQVLFHMHSLDVPAVVSKLIAVTKRDGSIKRERPRALTGGASAIVELTLSDKIVLEPFTLCRALGRFVLRRSGDTIAIGVIEEVLDT